MPTLFVSQVHWGWVSVSLEFIHIWLKGWFPSVDATTCKGNWWLKLWLWRQTLKYSEISIYVRIWIENLLSHWFSKEWETEIAADTHNFHPTGSEVSQVPCINFTRMPNGRGKSLQNETTSNNNNQPTNNQELSPSSCLVRNSSARSALRLMLFNKAGEGSPGQLSWNDSGSQEAKAEPIYISWLISWPSGKWFFGEP